MTSNVLPLHFAPKQASSSQNSNVDSYWAVLWSWFLETKLIWVIFTDIPVDHPITAPISAFAFSGNGFLILLICVERFVMIIYPEKSKIWCSKRKTIIYICVASLTSLLMSVPDFFAYSWDENGKVKPTDFHNKYWTIVRGLRLLNLIVGTTVMLTLSIIIAIKVSLHILNTR